MTKRSGTHKAQKERRKQALLARLLTTHRPAQRWLDGRWVKS